MSKAVIFDLDDTLVSEYEYIQSGYRAISKQLSSQYALSEDSVYTELMGVFAESTINVFDRWYAKHSISFTKKDVMQLVQLYRNHTPNIHYYEDVIPVLTKLKQRGIKLGMISDGYETAQSRKIEVLQAKEYFDKIILTDKLGKEFWKPNPKAFEIMQKYLEIPFEDMMYIGDNPAKDFYVGNVYPIKTVRIVREKGIYKKEVPYYKDIKEQMTIHSLVELLS